MRIGLYNEEVEMSLRRKRLAWCTVFMGTLMFMLVSPSPTKIRFCHRTYIYLSFSSISNASELSVAVSISRA